MPPYCGFPLIEGDFAEPILAAQLLNRHTCFRFFQDIYDLAFTEPRLLHVDHSLVYFAMSFPLFNGTILGDGYPCDHSRAGKSKIEIIRMTEAGPIDNPR